MPDIDKKAPATKLLWVDLEMTGLDPQRHRIIEIGAEVTDFDFKSLASYEAVVFQPDEVLADANDWTKQQMTVNGLGDKVRTEGRPEPEVRTLQGWRRELVGEELDGLLRGDLSLAVGEGRRLRVTG